MAALPTASGEVEAADLSGAGIPPGAQRLLLKTRNSGRLGLGVAFDEEFVSLGLGAARWIVDQGIRLVGVDYLSVGALTHSSPILDIALDLRPRGV